MNPESFEFDRWRWELCQQEYDGDDLLLISNMIYLEFLEELYHGA